MILDTLLHPALLLGAIVIGTVGEVVKKLVLGPKNAYPPTGFRGWRGVYYVTLPLHAMLAGAAIWGLPQIFGLHMPVSEPFESSSGEVLFGVIAGALAVIGYDLMVETARRAIRNYVPPTSL